MGQIMDINVISTFDNAQTYLSAAKLDNTGIPGLWHSHMIEPFWPEIAKYAPFDQDFKQPKAVTELDALEKQLDILCKLNVGNLQSKFVEIVTALPLVDDDPMIVALYPLCNSNQGVKERQNGVLGASVFGNVVININPLAKDWKNWIPFVFAHEYHHNIWGHNWYVMHGGQGIEETYLENMIIEGQADLFAESLFPGLIPLWNRPFDPEVESKLWEQIKLVLDSKDPCTHRAHMFGDEMAGLPWCMGYSFGRAIVADFMQKHPSISFVELLDIPCRRIFEESKYGKI